MIRVGIVEEKEMIAEHIRQVIDDMEDMECKHIFRDAEWGIKLVPELSLDILIVDIGLPGKKNGIDCVRELKALVPHLLFLMYTVFDQNDELFESLKVGANGYLLKNASDREIVCAIRELREGGSPMTLSIARKVTSYFYNRTSSSQKLQVLSPREKEILSYIAKGLLYKEIGRKLNLTTGTIKQHIHKIYKKLHVSNRTEATNIYTGLK